MVRAHLCEAGVHYPYTSVQRHTLIDWQELSSSVTAKLSGYKVFIMSIS